MTKINNKHTGQIYKCMHTLFIRIMLSLKPHKTFSTKNKTKPHYIINFQIPHFFNEGSA